MPIEPRFSRSAAKAIEVERDLHSEHESELPMVHLRGFVCGEVVNSCDARSSLHDGQYQVCVVVVGHPL